MSAHLGLSEQSCNECKRRKGKCDRLFPECSPCSRNRRHCLYERSTGRTPLTRKNLTEAEERLRRAEMRARVAERRANAAEERLANLLHKRTAEGTTSDAALLQPLVGDHDFGCELQGPYQNPDSSSSTSCIGLPGPAPTMTYTSETTPQSGSNRPDEIYTGLPEDPPSDNEDFSWDEISRVTSNIPPEDADPNEQCSAAEERDVIDGMASLKVEDQGYLGVASGVAVLRLLLPDAEHRRPTKSRRRTNASEHTVQEKKSLTYDELGLAEIDLDSAIDAYFGLYHLQYPIVHEPTFRAQYAQLIPRPNGMTFEALIYMIGAVGLFTTATDAKSNEDLKLFEAAKLNISIDVLEKGNITLVQVLVLMSNYLQKRGKPNSGYNYLGLALHMAMGLGLHKEFTNWKSSPLVIETRRRVWYTLYNFYTGALVTFGRPWSWPEKGTEVSLPLNIHDRDLTNISKSLPQSRQTVTTYTFMLAQARFHQLTSGIYTRVISLQYPSALELLQLDDELLGKWLNSLGSWYLEDAQVPMKFILGHNIMFWRVRNFRIIMYRPFVIRNVLSAVKDSDGVSLSSAEQNAINRCLQEAKASIVSIRNYWTNGAHTRLAAWYALYFLFQASLIPCLCLRNQPNAPLASDWRAQVQQTLSVLVDMASINPSSVECHAVILRLCGHFLGSISGMPTSSSIPLEATEESPQTQISNVYSMMWPSTTPTSADILMCDPQWGNFLSASGNIDLGTVPQDWDWIR